jgi:hypothetical protein
VYRAVESNEKQRKKEAERPAEDLLSEAELQANKEGAYMSSLLQML